MKLLKTLACLSSCGYIFFFSVKYLGVELLGMIRAFNSLRNCQTVFKEAVCVILGSHQRRLKIPDDFNLGQIVNWQLAHQSFNFSSSGWGVVVSYSTRGSRYHSQAQHFARKTHRTQKSCFIHGYNLLQLKTTY